MSITIQFRNVHVLTVHGMIMLQFNYKLLSDTQRNSNDFTFIKFISQSLIAGMKDCDIFVSARNIRRGLFLLHCILIGQRCNFLVGQ